MNHRITLSTVAFAAMLVVIAVAAVASGMFYQAQRNAQSKQNELRGDLVLAEQRIQSLILEKGDLDWRIGQMQKEMDALNVQTSVVVAEESETFKVNSPQPYQVEVYMGKLRLGSSWVYPSNAKQNLETGLYSFEPTVHLDQKLKTFFTEYRTNVVERTIADNSTTSYTTQNNNYPLYYPYYYSTFSVPSSRASNTSSGNRSIERGTTQPAVQFQAAPVVGSKASPWSSPFVAR